MKWKVSKELVNVLAYKKLENKIKNDFFLMVIHWSCTIIIANRETTSSAKEENEL
jgi:hypothetical protein